MTTHKQTDCLHPLKAQIAYNTRFLKLNDLTP